MTLIIIRWNITYRKAYIFCNAEFTLHIVLIENSLRTVLCVFFLFAVRIRQEDKPSVVEPKKQQSGGCCPPAPDCMPPTKFSCKCVSYVISSKLICSVILCCLPCQMESGSYVNMFSKCASSSSSSFFHSSWLLEGCTVLKSPGIAGIRTKFRFYYCETNGIVWNI